jgi:hypothetical protein
MSNVLVAVLAALPVGWGAGLLAAYAVSGGSIGQLPAFTIPVSVLVTLTYAVLPLRPAEERRNVLLAGAGFFVLLGLATG